MVAFGARQTKTWGKNLLQLFFCHFQLILEFLQESPCKNKCRAVIISHLFLLPHAQDACNTVNSFAQNGLQKKIQRKKKLPLVGIEPRTSCVLPSHLSDWERLRFLIAIKSKAISLVRIGDYFSQWCSCFEDAFYSACHQPAVQQNSWKKRINEFG